METAEEVELRTKVLKDVLAYVEVRSNCENRSTVIAAQLQKLGARITDKLNAEVTHVVFKDGTKRTLTKAKKLEIPLVSVLWVDSCKRNLEHVSEAGFPVTIPNNDNSMDFFNLFPLKRRIKSFRSMQPKNLNEDFEDSSQRCHRRRKRGNKRKAQENSVMSEPPTTPANNYDILDKKCMTTGKLTTPPSLKALYEDWRKNRSQNDCSDLQKKLFNGNSDEENSKPEAEKSSLRKETKRRFTISVPAKESFSTTSDVFRERDQTGVDYDSSTDQVSSLNSKDQQDKIFDRDGQPLMEPAQISEQKPSEGVFLLVGLVSSEKEMLTNSSKHLTSTLKRNSSKNSDPSISNPTENSTSKILVDRTPSNCCDTSLVDYKRDQKVPRKKSCSRETMHILGITEGDLVRPSDKAKRTRTLYKAKQCHRTDTSAHLSSIDSAGYLSSDLSQDVALASTSSHCRDTDKGIVSWSNSTVDDQQSLEPECDKHSRLHLYSTVTPISNSQSCGSDPTSKTFNTIKTPTRVAAKRKPIRKSFVMTSMHSDEQEAAKSVAQALGGSVFSDRVRKSTTHVICGSSRRTLNVLFGLSQGCWLVSKDWVFKSLEAHRWLDERKYEMVDSFPVAKAYRHHKQTQTSSEVFTKCGPLYVSAVTSPPKKDLVQLIQLCGGQVKTNVCDADVYVGEEYHPSMVSVTPLWLLDSISQYKALPFVEYLLGRPKPPSPEY